MLDASGKPITFSEWSLVKDDLVKRRDFRLDEMLQGGAAEPQMELFGSSGNATISWEYDPESDAFIPAPIKEYPLISIYKVMSSE